VGQKTHPKGFRLITTQKHLSNWYTEKAKYSSLLKEDFLIRRKVEEYFHEFLSISKIEISRITQEINEREYVTITIHSLFPRAKDMYKKINKIFSETTESKKINLFSNSKGNLKRFTSLALKKTIRNLIRTLQIQTKKNYLVSIKFIENPFEDANLIAKFIADQLEKRIPFRRAVKKAIKKVQSTSMKGIKVQVSGRLNGIDIARSEWKRDGKIPLHTLKANIEYTHQRAETIYGVIGIKVWLFVE